MIFTRAHLELKGVHWWLEMRPDPLAGTDSQAFVVLRAVIAVNGGVRNIEYRASMYAIEQNTRVRLQDMELVVDHHIEEFKHHIRAVQRGGRSSSD